MSDFENKYKKNNLFDFYLAKLGVNMVLYMV